MPVVETRVPVGGRQRARHLHAAAGVGLTTHEGQPTAGSGIVGSTSADRGQPTCTIFLPWYDSRKKLCANGRSASMNNWPAVEDHVGGRGLSGFVATAVESTNSNGRLCRPTSTNSTSSSACSGRDDRQHRRTVALILDSEALSARRPRRIPSPSRTRPLRCAQPCNEMSRPESPSATLVELYRGGGNDEPIDTELGRGYAKVVTTGVRTARIAGHLLAAAPDAGSDMAVDALVVATAIRPWRRASSSMHDLNDLRRLAADHPNIRGQYVQRPTASARRRAVRSRRRKRNL